MRILPHDLSFEKTVLAGMIIDATCRAKGQSDLLPEMFFIGIHQALFMCLKEMPKDIIELDDFILIQLLQEKGFTHEAKASFFAEIMDNYLGPVNFDYHANAIKDKYRLRELIKLCKENERNCYLVSAENNKSSEVASKMNKDLTKVISDTAKISYSARDLASNLASQLLEEPRGYIDTPLTNLNILTGGYPTSSLTIIAARTSQGKSSLALQSLWNLRDKNTLFVSCEMAREKVGERIAAIASGRTIRQIYEEQNRSIVSEEIIRSLDEIPEGLHVIDNVRNCHDICNIIRQHYLTRNIEVAVVDHLGEVTTDDRKETLAATLGQICKTFKALSSELGIVILLLCQLNREGDTERSERPRLIHLRNSGSIEEEADMVLLIWQQKALDTDRDVPVVIDVAKNRQGARGIVNCTFYRESMTFVPGGIIDRDD